MHLVKGVDTPDMSAVLGKRSCDQPVLVVGLVAYLDELRSYSAWVLFDWSKFV